MDDHDGASDNESDGCVELGYNQIRTHAGIVTMEL